METAPETPEPAPRKQSTETLAKLYEGRLRLERRNGGTKIYARTYLQGKALVKSTGERTLKAAERVATDWYLELRDRTRNGERLHGRSFAEIAAAFLTHAEQVREVSEGQRQQYRWKWELLKPHFVAPGHEVKVADIDMKFLLALRDARSQAMSNRGRPVKPATLKKDLDFVRLVLRHAKTIEKCIEDIPEFPSFRGREWEVIPAPRPYLNRDQWRRVRLLAKARIAEADNPRTQAQRQELYWFLLICVGAALRVGEAYSLRWRDCRLIELGKTKKTPAVELMVLGKHSRGGKREYGYGLYGAVSAFKAMQRARTGARPDDKLFLEQHRDGVRQLLIAAGLRAHEDGRTRDAKSLRQTGISLRLELSPNPDYRHIARWARTSPAMILAFYDQTHPETSAEAIAGFREAE